jgi:Na+/H+ antiporter NhaD/arsenite permease-like protein
LIDIKKLLIDFSPVGIGVAFVVISSYQLGFSPEQLFPIATIATMILTSLRFWNLRLPVAFFGLSFLFATGSMGIDSFIRNAKLDIIIFLLSMMLIIGHLETKHFFEGVIQRLIMLLGADVNKLISVLIFMSALSAALVDEVTSILFMVTITLAITLRLGVSPYPFVLLVIFATNIGSSATVVGNPVGVMIAFEGGLTFLEFLRWSAPVAFVALITLNIIAYIIFRQPIKELGEKLQSAKDKDLFDSVEIKDAKQSIIFFILVILGLVTHTLTENLLGLEKNTMLLGVALFGAGVALMFERNNINEFLEKRVEWKTLIFFLILFSGVGALKEAGVIETLTSILAPALGDSLFQQMGVMLIVSGLMSAALDNVIAVAILIPIVLQLEALPAFEGGNIYPLWWIMLVGGTYIGNLTPIGSTANIVALGMLEKRGLKAIKIQKWLQYSIPVVFITTGIAFLLMYLQFSMLY